MQFSLPWSMSGDVSYVGQHGFNLLQNVDINAVDFGVAYTSDGAGHDGCRQCDAWRLGAVGRSAAPLQGIRRYSAELGHRLEHLPLDPVVVQPALPQRILARPELHARAVEYRQCGKSRPARPPSRRQLLDPRRSGGAGRAAEGPRPAAPHHQGKHGVGSAEDAAGIGGAEGPCGDRQRLAAVGHPDGGHWRSLYRRLQLRRRRRGQCGRRRQRRRHRQPEPHRLPELCATDRRWPAIPGRVARATNTRSSTPRRSRCRPRRRRTRASAWSRARTICTAASTRPSTWPWRATSVSAATRNIQFRIEAFNAFNTVIYNGRNTTLQVTSPLVLTPTNAQYDASGNLVQTRLTPQNAGFGAANGAQAMRSVQAQIRFQF